MCVCAIYIYMYVCAIYMYVCAIYIVCTLWISFSLNSCVWQPMPSSSQLSSCAISWLVASSAPSFRWIKARFYQSYLHYYYRVSCLKEGASFSHRIFLHFNVTYSNLMWPSAHMFARLSPTTKRLRRNMVCPTKSTGWSEEEEDKPTNLLLKRFREREREREKEKERKRLCVCQFILCDCKWRCMGMYELLLYLIWSTTYV